MVLQEDMVVADRFRLVRMIGRGGMGSVWQAMHLSLDRPCAVKFIEGELANAAEAHARFEREAKAAAKLQSPHVVQIFDHGVWQGHPFIAMELLEGEDLGKRLARSGGVLTPAAVNTIAQQVCRALAKAHQAGIVHRDLKPDNIFLVRDDDNPEVVKILDFGVAKQTSQGLDGSNTKTGAMLGTPYYMSPEQAQGIKSVDARSDLWSLAVIVFQCLTARLPFESEALGDLLVKIIVNPIPMPSTYNAHVPPGFDRWWARAADRNPDGRFQTAKEFAQELAMALGQTNPTDMFPGIPQRTAVLGDPHGLAVRSNVPNTPLPQQTAALATPHPLMNTPGHAPPHANAAGGAPYGMAPGAQVGPSTGNPVAATFSGVEPPAGMPRKSPPLALIVGIAAIAIVGIALGGFALVRGRSAHAGGTAASGSALPSESGAAAVPTTAAEGTASSTSATASATATAPAAMTTPASASAAPTVASATSTAAPTTRPTVGAATAAGAGAAGTKATASAAKSAAPPTATAASTAPGKEKPINLGF